MYLDSGSTGGSSIVSNDNSKADTSVTADNDPVDGNNDSAEGNGGQGVEVSGNNFPKVIPLPETKISPFDPYKNKNFQNLSEIEKKNYLKEYSSQLQRQQDAINDMSAEEFKLARGKYDELKRNSSASGVQREFRKQFKTEVSDNLYEPMNRRNKTLPSDQRVSQKELKVMAKNRADEIANDLAALHEPDMVAGGWHDPMPSSMGKSNVNSAIGGSWSGGRLNNMDKASEVAIANGQGSAKMNVKLEVARGPR